MRDTIEMAREAGIEEAYSLQHDQVLVQFQNGSLKRFAELVRADAQAEEREKYKWDVHSCGPTCTKVACVARRKAVEDEREACDDIDASHWGCEVKASWCSREIRARGQQT